MGSLDRSAPRRCGSGGSARLSRLDRAADAGAGAGSGAAAALGRRRSRASIIAAAAAFSASGCARSAGRRRRGRCCSRPTTSPISTSRCSARCSPPRSSPRPRSPAGRCSAGWRELQRSVFIDRRVRSTAHQRDSIAARLAAGEALILFPEGTSGDGNRVLPFKSALFSVADHAGDRRGDGAAGVDRLYEARRHADRARAAAVLRLVRRDVAGAASVADAGSRARLEVVVEFHPPTTPGRLRLAQGAGALLRGAGRRAASPARLSGRRETPEPGAPPPNSACPSPPDALLRPMTAAPERP